jgi:hypothetical protein
MWWLELEDACGAGHWECSANTAEHLQVMLLLLLLLLL